MALTGLLTSKSPNLQSTATQGTKDGMGMGLPNSIINSNMPNNVCMSNSMANSMPMSMSNSNNQPMSSMQGNLIILIALLHDITNLIFILGLNSATSVGGMIMTNSSMNAGGHATMGGGGLVVNSVNKQPLAAAPMMAGQPGMHHGQHGLAQVILIFFL